MSKYDHGDGINLNKMIFFSCLVHIIALTILILSPSVPSPRWTFGPAYSVQLVSLSETLMEKGAQSSLASEVMDVDRGKHSVVVKKNTEAVQSVPIKRIEVQKDRESIAGKALENLRKNSPPAQRTEELRTASAGTKREASQGAKSGVGDRSLNRYYTDIWSRIKGQWVFPQSLSPKEKFSAVINVTILKNGAVTEPHFEKRSGNRYFDDSAMRAIRKASPFPPLPNEIGDKSIELGIRFHLEELR